MLKIARDQLEVSQQALRGPNAPADSFADAVPATPETASAYEALSSASARAKADETDNPAITNAASAETSSGPEIEQTGDVWRVGDQEFKSLDTAKLYAATLSAEGAKEAEGTLEWGAKRGANERQHPHT